MIVGQGEETRDELKALGEGIILQLNGHTLRLGIEVHLLEVIATLAKFFLEGFSVIGRDEAF